MRSQIALFLAVALLLVPASVMAETAGGNSGQGNSTGGGGPVFDIGAIVGPIVGAINNVPKNTANRTVGLFEKRLGDMTGRELAERTDVYTRRFAGSLQKKPDVERLEKPWRLLVAVIISFLAVLLSFNAWRMMLSGGSAERRAEAKESLRNVAVIFFGALGSFWIYTTLIDMTYAVSAFVYPGSLIASAYATASTGSLIARMALSILYFIVTGLAWLTLFLVKAMQTVGLLLFPIALLLYFSGWAPARQLGSSILMFLALMMFMPLLNVALFAGTYSMGFGWALAGLVLIIILNWSSIKRVFSMMLAPAVAVVGIAARGYSMAGRGAEMLRGGGPSIPQGQRTLRRYEQDGI